MFLFTFFNHFFHRPYRVVGGGDDEGTVTADPIISQWKERQITLISFSNATLMSTAVELFGMDMSTIAKNGDENEVEEEQERTEAGFSSEDDNNATFASEGHVTKSEKLEDFNILDTLTFPKIHINGKGENSGMRKWKYTLKQIDTMYVCWMFMCMFYIYFSNLIIICNDLI